MSGPFYERLRAYYTNVASVLRGEASAASIFPNASDIGSSRESIYAEFLRQHAPSKCNVFRGGFLFGEDGCESKQIDVIITTDTTPRFDFHNQRGDGKSFSPVDGALGVVSIKSTLDKKELQDSLAGFASIPPVPSLENRVAFGVKIQGYDDWPLKVIYASDGISLPALLGHLNDFYVTNPDVPIVRRPNIVHVSGKYVISRVTEQMSIWHPETRTEEKLESGTFYPSTNQPDLQGIVRVLEGLQERATASTHILYSYTAITNSAVGIP